MEKKRWSGAIGVIALVAGLYVLSRADDSERRKLTVTVLAAPSFSLTCSPPNLRNGTPPGTMVVTWACSGDHVHFTSVPNNGNGAVETHDLSTEGPNGQHVHHYPYDPPVIGWYKYTATCHRDADGADVTASCQSILHCFPAGTKVNMCEQDASGTWQPSSTQKNIEDVQAGDEVVSYDTTNPDKPFSCQLVNARTQTQSDQLYHVYVGTQGAQLEVTAAHPLWVIRDGRGSWMASDDLRTGDQLISADGTPVTVTSVQNQTGINISVYDLITDYPNDFFADNYLVHNLNQGADARDRGFLRGTKVVLASGRAVPIEKIKVGDRLMAVNPKTGDIMFSTVRRAFSQRVHQYVTINHKLRMAAKHPLMKLKSKA